MIKELKKDSFKTCQKTILSCMVIAAVTISNCSTAKALDTNNIMTAVSSNSQINVNGENKFIIDSHLKAYEDINKAENAAGFKFKVPDFLPDDKKPEVFHVRKVKDNDNVVEIYFEGADKSVFDVSLQVSKIDHVEALKKIKTEQMGTTKNPIVDTKQETMKQGKINGTSLTLSITSPSETLKSGYVTQEFTEVNKYFIWENDGVSYSLKYNTEIKKADKTCKNKFSLSEDAIEKIAESIKYPEEIKSVSYSLPKRELSTEEEVMSIYDKEDLEKAKGLLGFNPKLPLKINDDISIKDSGVGISYGSDIKNNKIIYELNSFYSNKNGSITFWEGRTSKDYDEIKKNGYLSEKNWKINENIQIKVDKLNVNNKEVFKYIEKSIEDVQEGSINYIWKEDGIYYAVIFFGNTDSSQNTDEISKAFVNSIPLN